MTGPLLLAIALGQAADPTPANPTNALMELTNLDRTLKEIEDKIASIDAEAKGRTAQIAELESSVAEVKVTQKKHFETYKKRVRALSRQPMGARLAVIGGAASVSDYLQSSRLLRRIARHDAEVFRQHTEESNRLRALQATLQTRQRELEELSTELRRERDGLAEERRKRADLIASISASESAARAVAKESRTAATALKKLVRRFAPATRADGRFAANKGRLPWPSEGAVTTRFGQTVEMAFGTAITHNGVAINSPAGGRVMSVAPGTTAYAGWLHGYGQVVIIDHGDNFHTISAHLATASVKEGEPVEAGAVIGTVGDTGSLRGTQLYFEVRQDGKAQNPESWLRKL